MKSIVTLMIFVFFQLLLWSQPTTQIGVNLVDNGAFVDIVKHTNRYNNAEGFDENGWPTSDFDMVLMDGRPAREWADGIDDPEEYRIDYSGTYQCSFSGYAELSVWGSGSSIENFSWDEQTNTSYFDLVIPGSPDENHGIVVLTFANTTRSVDGPTNSGVRNIKAMRPGYELSTEKIFTDEYIALCQAADFACYRYYGVQNIWSGEPAYPEITRWENRKTPEDASQNSMQNTNGKMDAWCWEYIIELANRLNKDIWVCIHISCDSNYVVNLAQMLKDELNDNINIYIENSNEVWSPTHMTHGPYNQAQADEYGIGFNENYARRSVELSNLFAQVFGGEEINNRIRVILAGQHSYSGRSDLHLNYINDTFGAPNQYIYATSTGLYFGSTKASETDPLEINAGMIEDISGQINDPQKSTYRNHHINKASNWNFKGGCTSYEGGPGLPAGGALENLDNQILANRTEAMKNVIKYSYKEGWANLDGGLAMFFTLATGYNRYGCWGLTDDYTNPDRNYKMQAMRELIAELNGTEVEDIEDTEDVVLIPNPATDYIEINLKYVETTLQPISENVEVFDVLGQSVNKESFNKSTPLSPKESGSATRGGWGCVIDVSHLQPGIYFIRVGDEFFKFVKM